MSKNSDEFSVNAGKQMAQSDVGQQLFAHLKKNNAKTLSDAMEQVSSGNMDGAKAAIANLLADPKVREFMRQFGGGGNG